MIRRVVAYLPIALALLPYAVFAQQNRGLPSKIVPCTGINCGCDDLITLAQNLINTGIFIAVFLSALIFAYAGWLYLSNEAIHEQQRARRMFSYVVTGLIIILAAWLIVDTLMGTLLKDNVSWNNICSRIMK